MADLSRNCKGFCARESVQARVTESGAQGTGVGRDIRQSPSRVRSVFLLIYETNKMAARRTFLHTGEPKRAFKLQKYDPKRQIKQHFEGKVGKR